MFQALEAELPDWRKKEILDVGCGTGAILKQLGNPEKNVGIDVAPEALSFCRQRGLNNVRQGDIGALPFADASFDAVICSSVLYHQWVSDIPGAAREMHRILRPGGLLLINVPAFPFLHSAHDEAVMTARRFRKAEIRQLLLKQNFKIRRLTYWTTFLFPLAVAARTLGGSKMGRDFEVKKTSLSNRLFGRIMTIELKLLKTISFPFGVALFAVAKK
ncbi:MAG: methyltransferase type 11 [Verrucomicrobia bacterium]|nr:MAG: methyltransferase type 11 [Verrucomicrobiota bacterium]